MIIKKSAMTLYNYQGLSTDNRDILLDSLGLSNCGSEFFCVDTGDTYILNTTADNSTSLMWYKQNNQTSIRVYQPPSILR